MMYNVFEWMVQKSILTKVISLNLKTVILGMFGTL